MDETFWQDFEKKYVSDPFRSGAMWSEESPKLKARLDEVLERISPRFIIDKVLGIGGGGVTIRVIDNDLSVTPSRGPGEIAYAVLKLARPLADGANMNAVLLREMERLSFLRHQNIVRIIQRGTTLSEYNYYVMEYMHDVKDAHRHMYENPGLNTFLKIALGASRGIREMHNKSIYHLDIKPENIFVAGDDVVVADLGFAKKILIGQNTELIGGTQGYKHPDYDLMLRSLSSAEKDLREPTREMSNESVTFELSSMRPEWDVYSLGVTFLVLLRFWEVADVASARSYEHRYIKLMAHRMLDGRISQASGLTVALHKAKVAELEDWLEKSESVSGTRSEPIRLRRAELSARPLVDSNAAGLTENTLMELRYRDISDVIRDLEKLSGECDLARDVPELSYQQGEVIQASSHGPVGFTPRVRLLVDSGPVRDLVHVDQLGLARLVYPNATHSRFEHTLGTYQMAARYARALYDDPVSPIFKQLMGHMEISLLLAAAILHDVGHYPLAHDLEEVNESVFSHEHRTTRILMAADSRLRAVLQSAAWSIDVDRLINMLRGKANELDFKDSILRSILDGPIDADKLDYLTRDSENLRLPYGAGIDVPKLIQSLTILVRPLGARNIGQVGIREKGRVPAESLAFARYAMYGSVYWHRTHRTAKAMLNRLALEVVHKSIRPTSRKRDSAILQEELELVLGSAENPPLPFSVASAISSPYLDQKTTDVVLWLAKIAGSEFDSLAVDLLNRRLYKRVLVATKARGEETGWGEVATTFGSLGRNANDRRGACLALQAKLFEQVSKWSGTPVRLESAVPGALAERFMTEKPTAPLCIIDFPPAKVGSKSELGYLREEEWSGQSPGSLQVDDIEPSSVWNALSREYGASLGKLRVLVKPEYASLIRAAVSRETLLHLTMDAIGNPLDVSDDYSNDEV